MIADEIKTRYSQTKWALGLRGLFGITLGLFIIARPLASVAALALVIAIWALIDGITNIVRAFMVRRLVSHWWVLLLSGVIGVAFGIAALYFYPALSLSFAVIWTSLWLLTGGIMAIYVAAQEKQADLPWGWTMTFGGLTVIAGLLALMYPGLTLAWLVSLIAAVGIAGGIMMLIATAKLNGFERDVKSTVRSADDNLGRQVG